MTLLKKGSKLYSIFKNKCPKCHEGDLFKSHPYKLKKFGQKHINCPSCGIKFEREPGFFYGSMYISYVLGVAIFVTWWIVQVILFPDMGPGTMGLIMLGLQVALGPLNTYLSKLT